MALPHITSFCCCMGLEMGTRLIGVVHLISSIIVTIICAYIAETLRSNIGTVEDAEDHLYTQSYKITCGITVISSVHLILAFILLIGVFKKNLRMLRSWVIVMSILFMSSLVYIITVTVMYGISASGSDIFIAFIEGLIFFSILGYCILCVNSFYLMLKSSEDMLNGAKY